MIYVNDGKLDADEVKVADSVSVQALVKEGWHILAIVGHSFLGPESTSPITWYGGNGQCNSGSVSIPGRPVFEPQFIMGRDNVQAQLKQQVLDAVAKEAKAIDRIKQLEDEELAELRTRAQSLEIDKGQLESQNSGLHEKHASVLVANEKLSKETEIVRREVGEAKWREIVSALHVEGALDAEKPVETDDGDIPF